MSHRTAVFARSLQQSACQYSIYFAILRCLSHKCASLVTRINTIPFGVSIFRTLMMKLVFLQISVISKTYASLVCIPRYLGHIFWNIGIHRRRFLSSILLRISPKPNGPRSTSYKGVLLAPVVSFSGITENDESKECQIILHMKERRIKINVTDFVGNLLSWNDGENVGSYVHWRFCDD